MHETREFEENIKSKAKAIRMAEKAVKEGHYNIFVDKYEYDKEIDCNDLIMSWSFGKHY